MKTTTVSLRVDEALVERIAALERRARLTRSAVIRSVMAVGLRAIEANPGLMLSVGDGP
jgi:predicted transcriptional regulator